jgi:hypothetical protein
MFAGLQAAAVVFVVGWLLLVPGTAVLAGPPGPGTVEGVAEREEVASRVDSDSDTDDGRSDGATADPVDQLRDRYASGDIDEVEFERRLEALLETKDVDASDGEAIQQAVDRLDTETNEPAVE